MPRQKNTAMQAAKKIDNLGKIADLFSGFAPAVQVLTNVKAVPTIFHQFNRGVGVGGWPTQRIAMIHGPSNHGKTQFLLGLNLSFLIASHYAAHVDAELTTPEAWVRELMGDYADSRCFRAMRPRNYEEVASSVRSIAEVISHAKAEGTIPAETACIVGIDSIRKLVPEKLLDKISKGADGLDGAKGRGAMMRAALNAQWLDELAPLAYHAGLAPVLISRETENPNSDPWEPDFKVTGGVALVYESSLVLRIVRDNWVKAGSAPKKGESDTRKILGERHLVRITKTKVSGKEGKVIDSYFHTSNGTESPAGFDIARDVFDLCERLKIIEVKGSWYSYNGNNLGQGEVKAVQAIRERPELQAELVDAFQPGEGEIVD
jgi:recombination protein RecA